VKPLLMDLLKDEANVFRRRHMAREFLQAQVLLALQDHGAFADWAFVGGTALRFLYRLPRYSEDLDFSLVGTDRNPRFERHMSSVQRDLSAQAYDVEVKVRTRATVASAHVKFRGLLYEIGVSPHRDEVFMVKVDLDTKPPAGAGTETRVLRRFVMLNLHHYDRASLLAGKLHAVLTRKYTKGRDLYDLAWYLADDSWPAPNLLQLNNALQQTGWTGATATPKHWRTMVAERLESVEWKQAQQDVSPFLEREQDLELVSKASLAALLNP
jgi:predicted nucleotidyltransferase component of viral defense system